MSGNLKLAVTIASARHVLRVNAKELDAARKARDEIVQRERNTAVAMGQHARLGTKSQIAGLSPDLLRLVLTNT